MRNNVIIEMESSRTVPNNNSKLFDFNVVRGRKKCDEGVIIQVEDFEKMSDVNISEIGGQ
jgi:hypothetical protein